MMRTEASLTAAARAEGVDPRTVKKYLGDELRHSAPGKRYHVAKSDRKHRNMFAVTPFGMEPIDVKGSRQASVLGKYLAKVGEVLRGGDPAVLAVFEGKTVGGKPLITDLDLLNTLAQAGALQLEEIYAMPESSS